MASTVMRDLLVTGGERVGVEAKRSVRIATVRGGSTWTETDRKVRQPVQQVVADALGDGVALHHLQGSTITARAAVSR